MFHRSERLFLRPAWPEDWQAIWAGVCDEGVVRNLARAPWPYGEHDAREFAGLAQDQYLPHFLITLPGSGVIGSAGLAERDGAAELGYWIARSHWGRGFATEAGRSVIEIARSLGHRRLKAGHFVDNPASGKVLRKLGFRPTGALRLRFSRARGCDVPSAEFELELAEPTCQMPQAA